MRLLRSFSALGCLVLFFGFAGCRKTSGDAIVLAKDYVPAAAATPSPNESPPNASPEPTTTPVEETADGEEDVGENETEAEEEAAEEEIGPPLDPRALDREQWIVTVQMISNLRRMDVRLERAHWDSLKAGDRVHVTYREGEYTGTVWSAAID